MVLAGKIRGDAKLGWQEFALLIFVLLFVGGFFDRLAELSFGKEGFHAQFNQLRTKQEVQEQELAAIRIALTGLITEYEYQHLTRLNSLEPYPCKFGHIFFDEIRRLDSVGFIRPTSAYTTAGFNAIQQEHESKADTFDLKQYVEVTDEGRAHLEARKGAAAHS